MAIKVIEQIPIEHERKSSMQQIKDDIQEAIEKGIQLFEFTGDYNYKYLANYAREAARDIRRKKIYEIHKKFRENYFTDDEKNKNGFHVFFKPSWEYKKDWIIITSRKGENRKMVFCKIDDEREFEKKIIEDCKKQLSEARAEYVLNNGKWERIK